MTAPENYFRGVNFNNLLVFVIFLIIEVIYLFILFFIYSINH